MTNADDLKGRGKEALGDLTDNDDLKREGKVDQATGAVKRHLVGVLLRRVAAQLMEARA